MFGAYTAQKLQTPLGLDDSGHPELFWPFSLAVMALLASVFVVVALLVRAIHRPWRVINDEFVGAGRSGSADTH